jgi:cytoskeletal protein RodZ
MIKSIWTKVSKVLAGKGLNPFRQKNKSVKTPKGNNAPENNSDGDKTSPVESDSITDTALVKTTPIENKENANSGESATAIKLSSLGDETALSTDVAIELGHECANCGTLVQGDYCGKCGQRDRDLRRPIWIFIYDLFDDFLALDGRIVHTMGPLLFLPGKMTNDFVDGKRARFVPPIRLYLFASIFFFLVVSATDIAIINFEWTERSSAEKEKAKEVQERLNNKGININFSEDADEEDEKPKEFMTKEQIDARKAELIGEINALKEQMMGTARANADHTHEDADAPDGSSKTEGAEAEKPAAPKLSMRELRISLAKRARELAELQGYERDANDSNDSWDDMALNSVISGNEKYQLNADMFIRYDEDQKHVVPPQDQFEKYKGWAVRIKEDEKSTEMEIKVANFGEKVIDGFYLASQDPRRLNNTLNDWVQRFLLLLLPFFALLLRFFYWNKRNMLIRQLVFSLHFHTYIFLMLAILLIAQAVVGSAVSAWMFLAAVPLYLFIGLKVISKNGFIRTFFKFFMISIIYITVLSISVTFAVLMSLADL